MKLDITKKLTTFTGEVIKDVNGNGEAVDATIRMALVNAVLSPVQKETGMDKVRKYELAKRIHDQDEVELSKDDVELIKERVGELYTPMIVGQIFELLAE